MAFAICEYCDRNFTRISSLYRHKRTVHQLATSSRSSSIKCLSCFTIFSTLSSLREHLKLKHGASMSEETREFQSLEEFYIWKQRVEKDTAAFYKCLKGTYVKTNSTRITRYVCNRSGIFKEQGTGKRRPKSQGSCKIGACCTAFMTVEETDTVIRVNFSTDHYGHDQEIQHLRLAKPDRISISAKLEQGISMQRCMDDIRESFDGENLGRIHLTTKKDIFNIIRDGESSKKQAIIGDKNSVEGWIKDLKDSVLFFKQQGVDDVSGTFSREDFFLAFMTPAQQIMLEKFGKEIICVDSTHGTNQGDFLLVTVLVIDEFRRGFPVAFCLCGNENEKNLTTFFQAIKEKVGVVITKVLMTDDAPAFNNAWSSVMGPAEHHLLCTWHVDRAWRQQLKKVKGEKIKKEKVYKCIKALMEYEDKNNFHSVMENIIEQLQEDEDSKDFAIYFKAFYGSRPEKWAFCFRRGCFISTNNYIESMHKGIKYEYLHGRHNKRVDKLLNTLLKLVRDKYYERLIRMRKGRTADSIKKTHERHMLSKSILSHDIQQISAQEWEVKNSDGKKYDVLKGERSCPVKCRNICIPCKICIHSYTCSCMDNLVHGNLCKHIHAIVALHARNEPSEQPLIMKDSDESRMNLASGGQHEQGCSTSKSELVQLTIDKAKSLIKTLTDHGTNADEKSLINTIKALGKMDTLFAKQNAVENKPQFCPGNKKIIRQQSYVSNKRPRFNKTKLKRPTTEEKNLITESFSSIKNQYYIHSGFDHNYCK